MIISSFRMCAIDSNVSLGIEVDCVAFDQFQNILVLFSGGMLSMRLFFTIYGQKTKSQCHIFQGFISVQITIPNERKCYLH